MDKSFGESAGDIFFDFFSKYPFWLLLFILFAIFILDLYGKFYRKVNTDNIDLMEKWIKLERWRKNGRQS